MNSFAWSLICAKLLATYSWWRSDVEFVTKFDWAQAQQKKRQFVQKGFKQNILHSQLLAKMSRFMHISQEKTNILEILV